MFVFSKKVRLVFLFFTILFLIPNESKANAISPILNLFTPETAVFASILTILIILIETLLLRRWIKPISFRSSLFRATIINIVSSTAGSLALWFLYKDTMSWWIRDFTNLFIPMYFLTVAIETPVLRYLYRKSDVSWGSSIGLSFSINFISYIAVFVFQISLIYPLFAYSSYAHNQALKNWNDYALLKEETGYIYAVKYKGERKYRHFIFNRFDVEENEWETLDPGFENGIDPFTWDVKGNLIACQIGEDHSENRNTVILNAKTLAVISKIEGNFEELRISPDLKKLAVLEFVKEVEAPRDHQSNFMLGSAHRLKVYNLKDGELLYEGSRLITNESLAWSSDSSSIVASSLRDKSLYNSKDAGRLRSYGRGYAKLDQFPIDLFIFDINSGSVVTLIEGQNPRAIPGTNEILFLRETRGFDSYELWRVDTKKREPKLILKDVNNFTPLISPSGDKYLLKIPHNQPLSMSNYLTIIDPSDDTRKLIIEPYSSYGVRWVKNE